MAGHKGTHIYLLISLLVLASLSFQVQSGFTNGQDAFTQYLIVSRYIAETNIIPDGVPYTEEVFDKPPLIVLLGGLLFKFIVSEKVIILIPLGFFALSLLFLSKICGVKQYLILCLLVVFSGYFLNMMSWFYQEAPLFFFSTLFLYSIKKNRTHLAFFSSGMALLSKITGFMLLPYSLYLLMRKGRKALPGFIFLHMLPLIWYLRNYLKFNEVYHANLARVDVSSLNYFQTHGFMQTVPVLILWAILTVPYFKMGGYSKEDVRLHIFAYVSMVLIWFNTPDSRFLIVFYPFALYYTSKALEKLLSKETNEMQMGVLLTFLVLASAHTIYLNLSNPIILDERDAIVHLRGIAPEGTHILVNSDHGFAWFGKFNIHRTLNEEVKYIVVVPRGREIQIPHTAKLIYDEPTPIRANGRIKIYEVTL